MGRRRGHKPTRFALFRKRLLVPVLATLAVTAALVATGAETAAANRGPGTRSPGKAQCGGDRDRRPDGRVDAGDGQRQLADRQPGGDVREQLRQLRALLPLARHLPHRPVHAQPRRARQRARPTAASAASSHCTETTTSPSGFAGLGLLHRDGGQVPERLREPTQGAAGLVGVARGGPGHAVGLQLHAERERHPGGLRPGPRRLQAGRADEKGGQPRQPPGADGEAVLPLAHLHGSPRRRTEPEPQPAIQLQQHGEARAAPRPRVRLRAAAEAAELQRAQRLRQARRDPEPPALERGSDRGHPAQVPLPARVRSLRGRGRPERSSAS